MGLCWPKPRVSASRTTCPVLHDVSQGFMGISTVVAFPHPFFSRSMICDWLAHYGRLCDSLPVHVRAKKWVQISHSIFDLNFGIGFVHKYFFRPRAAEEELPEMKGTELCGTVRPLPRADEPYRHCDCPMISSAWGKCSVKFSGQ